MFLSSPSKKKSKGNQKVFKLNENANIRYQNVWNSAQAVLRGKFIALNIYMRKEENFQINNLKKLEKEEQRKSKVSKRTKIIKIRIEINRIEKEKIIEKTNKMKSWVIEKINYIDKPLTKLGRKAREHRQAISGISKLQESRF